MLVADLWLPYIGNFFFVIHFLPSGFVSIGFFSSGLFGEFGSYYPQTSFLAVVFFFFLSPPPPRFFFPPTQASYFVMDWALSRRNQSVEGLPAPVPSFPYNSLFPFPPKNSHFFSQKRLALSVRDCKPLTNCAQFSFSKDHHPFPQVHFFLPDLSSEGRFFSRFQVCGVCPPREGFPLFFWTTPIPN